MASEAPSLEDITVKIVLIDKVPNQCRDRREYICSAEDNRDEIVLRCNRVASPRERAWRSAAAASSILPPSREMGLSPSNHLTETARPVPHSSSRSGKSPLFGFRHVTVSAR
jgi:hypothetical protein